LNVLFVSRQAIRLRPSLAGLHWRSALAQAIPFGIIQLLVAVEGYMGSVLLSAAVPDTVLGYYGAANSLLAALILIPNAIQMAIFPHMAEVYASSRQSLNSFYLRIYRYLVVFGGAVVIGLLVMAEWLTVLLYRGAFRPSAILLQILGGTLYISFLNVPNVRAMIIADQQRRMAEMLFICVAFNVALTILLIPALGVLAVPMARLASMVCFFGMNQLYVNRQIVRAPLHQIFWRPLVGMGVGLLLVIATHESPIWLQLGVGQAGYFATFLALGGLPRDERRYLRSVLANRPTVRDADPD
jgi:O-antigen/teichoic acid export membrane protein